MQLKFDKGVCKAQKSLYNENASMLLTGKPVRHLHEVDQEAAEEAVLQEVA